MALITCSDCSQQISDQATDCPHCGRPHSPNTSEASQDQKGMWQAVLKSRTPINVFALAMMACAAVFGYSATRLEAHAFEAFTYCLHMFLAVSGMFFVCLLFCRSSIYHPEELAKAKASGLEFPKDRPVIAALIMALMVVGYSLYQKFA